jgi:hypothetical protein
MEKASSLARLITALKNEVPPVKKGGVAGFFSTSPLTSVEYAPKFINKNQLEKNLGLKQVKWLIAGQTHTVYMFAMDSENLYCKHGGYRTRHPPSGDTHEFQVSTIESGGNTFPIYAIPLGKIKEILMNTVSGAVDTAVGAFGYEVHRLVFNLTNGKNLEFNYMLDDEGLHLRFLGTLFTELQTTLVRDDLLETAKRHEKLLEFNQAAEIYKKLEMDDEVIRVRKSAMNKVEQTVVHGDYVDDRDTTYIDDRDTIVKDSVLNRSNVGGGSSKMQELKDLTAMKKEGLIDDDEFKQMKREILGK